MNLGRKLSDQMESPSKWESYFCNVNDSLSSVSVDLELIHTAPNEELPKLAWLWIRLNNPRDDGLSREEEFEALCRYEDELADAVNEQTAGLYVGRITTCGRREFYFYIGRDIEFRAVVDGVLENHQDYLFQVGEKPDPSWSHYLDLLYPGKNGLLQIARRREENNNA